MIFFGLDCARDIPLAQLLFATCRERIDILVLNFFRKDEFGWKKPKSLSRNFQAEHIAFLRKYFPPNRLHICNHYFSYKIILRKADVYLTRGRDLTVCKPIARHNVFLSMNRIYLGRLSRLIPYYQANDRRRLSVFMHSPAWCDRTVMGRFGLNPDDDDSFLDSGQIDVHGIDILGHHYALLEKEGRAAVRKKLGIPDGRKVLTLSYRMSPEFSIHDDFEAFIKCVQTKLEEFKSQGYFVISRGRVGKHDFEADKHYKTPHQDGFREIEHLVDLQVNGSGDFPDYIWRILYVSDFLFLADISGICYVESALCRCPVYMPFENKTSLLVKLRENGVAPPIVDMLERGLINNSVDENFLRKYAARIEGYLAKWYNTNLSQFWNVIKGG